MVLLAGRVADGPAALAPGGRARGGGAAQAPLRPDLAGPAVARGAARSVTAAARPAVRTAAALRTPGPRSARAARPGGRRGGRALRVAGVRRLPGPAALVAAWPTCVTCAELEQSSRHMHPISTSFRVS